MINSITKKQSKFLKGLGFNGDMKDMSRQLAYFKIAQLVRVRDEKKYTFETEDKEASLKIKRILSHHHISFRPEIKRSEAVSILENLGFFVNDNDSIERN